MALLDNIARQLVEDLNNAKSRRKQSEIISSYQAMNACSRNTVLRAARKFGWKSGRETRSDKGKLKANLADEQITALIKIRMGTRDKKYKVPRIPLWRVLQIAESEGILSPGQLSVNQLRRLFADMDLSNRDLRMGKDKPDPIRMRTEYPNHCWEVDTALRAQIRLRDDGRLMYVESEDYRNKEGPGAGKPKVALYMIVDHFSGAFFVKYYNEENVLNMADFIYEAFSPKPDMNLEPMRGIPRILFGDKGSVCRAGPIQNMLKRLGIRWIDHMPGKSRAKGAVEVTIGWWQRCFETGLKLQPAKTLDELNEWIVPLRQYLNSSKIHSRHKMTRALAWNLIPEDRLILPPDYELYRELVVASPTKRKVYPGRIIKFEGAQYHIGGQHPTNEHIELVGTEVEVIKSPYKWNEQNRVIEIRTADGVIYELQPVKRDIHSFPVGGSKIGK